jgi:hypothetical protein
MGSDRTSILEVGMRVHARVLSVSVVCALLWAPICSGQWSGDPAANLVIADRSGPQVQAKIVATTDGGFYVSWFDNSTGGYDVYLQRLNAAGVEQWAHNGVLVADRGFDWTQEYGLAVDEAGYALLAFGDGPQPGDEIRVARIDPDGNLVWGPDGIMVNTGGDALSPRVAGASDGNIAVAWTQGDALVVQKLDPSGAPLWGSGVSFSPPYGIYFVADLQASDAGNVIVSWVHGGYPNPPHLWAQKLAAADGAPLWGAGHVPVLDSGSLQMGNFPPFTTDGAGGAVFAWYINSDPSPYFLECRVQHVLANGTEAFTHNGVDVSTFPTRQRVGPSAAYLSGTGEIVVFWTEENADQDQYGLYGQKLDAAGARQWTDAGRELVPMGGNLISSVTTLPFADGAMVAWVDSVNYLVNEPLRAARVDGDGDFVWATPIVELSTVPTPKSDVVGALSTGGYGAFAWTDGDEMASSDIPVQNLNGDGSLGSSDLFSDGFESGDTSVWSATVP